MRTRTIVLAAALWLGAVASAAGAQSLTSDKADYSPGETATLTGSGFTPGEGVVLRVRHADGSPDSGADHEPWTVAADENGGFVTTWHVCEDDCIDQTLIAAADGLLSGSHAEATFTDQFFYRLTILFTPLSGDCGLTRAFHVLLEGWVGGFFGGSWVPQPGRVVTFRLGSATTTATTSFGFTGPPLGVATGFLTIPADATELRASFCNSSGLCFEAVAPFTLSAPCCAQPKILQSPASITDCSGRRATFSVSATGSEPLAYQWRKDGIPIPGANAANYMIPAIATADAGLYDVEVTNACGRATSAAATLVVNPPTTISCPPDVTIEAGEPKSPPFTGTATATGSRVTIAFSDKVTPGCGASAVITRTWIATGLCGTASCVQTVTILDRQAPVVTLTGPASGSVYPIGSEVSFSATFEDAYGSPHTASWSFDGASEPGVVTEGSPGTVTATHTFNEAGVYLVSLAVTDACGNVGTASQIGGVDALVVIYDPNAGFVTGGGWIASPPGALVADPALGGKANFGFVSKYQNGASAPTGETEFQYRIGNLNFHSTEYEWLVVAGKRAQFKGRGTVNGTGDYGFMLTAIDGNIAGGDPDCLRMKITAPGGGLIYDNLLNAPDTDEPTTLLGGGSIVIHNGGGSGAAAMSGGSRDEGDVGPAAGYTAPAEFALSPATPNPFNRSTRIAFSLPERSRLTLAVYDLAGREVRVLASGEWAAGRHAATFGAAGDDGALGAGVYFVRMNAQSLASGRSFSALRRIVRVK